MAPFTNNLAYLLFYVILTRGICWEVPSVWDRCLYTGT